MLNYSLRARFRPLAACAALLGAALVAQTAQAAVVSTPVVLQNATATLSQNASNWSIDKTIDGVLGPSNGWAIQQSGGATLAQTAVWETAADLSATSLTFQMVQDHVWIGQNVLIGRFRLSTTTDDRSTFADGLATGGDVTATWTVLENPTITGITDMVFTTLLDNSVLVSGTLPLTAVYELTYNVALSGVTGIRLEVMEHPSLPTGGPGAAPSNGNIALTEFIVSSAVPVPAALPLLAGGLGLLGLMRARRRG